MHGQQPNSRSPVKSQQKGRSPAGGENAYPAHSRQQTKGDANLVPLESIPYAEPFRARPDSMAQNARQIGEIGDDQTRLPPLVSAGAALEAVCRNNRAEREEGRPR